MADGYRASLADIYGDPQLTEEERLRLAQQGRQARAYVPTQTTATPIYLKTSGSANPESSPSRDKQEAEAAKARQRQELLNNAQNAALGYEAGASSSSAAGAGLSSGVSTSGAGSAVGSTYTVGAGEIIPSGYTAVGSSASGGTMVSPGAAGAGSKLGGYAGSAGIAVGVAKAIDSAQNLAAYRKRGGPGLTQSEIQSSYGHGGVDKFVREHIDSKLEKLPGRPGIVRTNPVNIITRAILGSGKNDDQIRRDRIRETLKKTGAVDKEYNVRLADGSRYNIGVDGKNELLNKGGGTRRAYEIDETNELAPQTIAYTNPLAAIVSGGDDKLKTDYAGYYTNAATSNAVSQEDARRNAQLLYQDHGISYEAAHSEIDRLQSEGKIDRPTAEAYHNGVNQAFNYYGPPTAKRSGKSSKLPDTGSLVDQDARTGRTPNIEDITPSITTPGGYETPDNAPSAAEQASVDQYLNDYSETLRRGGSAAGRKRRT